MKLLSFKHFLGLAFVSFLLTSCGGMAIRDTATAEDKIKDSTTVFGDLTENVPADLLSNATAVLAIPNVKKLALFGLGGEAGVGILSRRNAGDEWSNPVFVNISSASAGLQLGIQSTDLVLVIMDYGSIDDILSGKFTLGAEGGVAAGPVGADAAIDTNAKIYTYSRNSGLYAGIALEGLVLSVSDAANSVFYGREVDAAEVLQGDVNIASSAAQNFRDTLSRVMR